jgi:UDP-N-acetylmuramyl pentapeptide phosphotransferase/UDP-N-acetylglucosamine-1-phosphate transferase
MTQIFSKFLQKSNIIDIDPSQNPKTQPHIGGVIFFASITILGLKPYFELFPLQMGIILGVVATLIILNIKNHKYD